MLKWTKVVVLVLLVLIAATAVHQFTVQAGTTVANSGNPVPPTPWLVANSGNPVPPTPWAVANSGNPVPPTPWSR